jgi:acyl dehydratase
MSANYRERLGVLNQRRRWYDCLTMSRYWLHIPNQAAGLGALGGLIQKAAVQAWRVSRGANPTPETPALGISVRRRVALPPLSLQRDFVRFCGGDPSRYAGRTPPHLFSQWAVPVALLLAKRLPYPPLSVVNLGCSLRIDGLLPARGAVDVQCTLTDISQEDGKVFLTLALLTLVEHEVRLRVELKLLVRLPGQQRTSNPGPKPRREPPRVPADAREVMRRRLGPHAGLEFAELTGDFNPIHWIPAYARMTGFKAPILHGLGSLGIAFEGLVQGRLSGRVDDVRRIDADFTAPLLLPREVGVFSRGGNLWVADAAAGPAYMVARVELV